MGRSAQKLWLRLGISAVFGGLLLLLVRDQLELVPSDMSLEPLALVGYLALLLVYFALRAGRWQLLVRPLVPEGDAPPSIKTTTLAALAGIMWIMLLPLRLGELARPLFLAQKSKIKASALLGTIALERVVDGLIVCATFFGSIFYTRSSQLDSEGSAVGDLITWGMVVTGLLLCALLVLLAMAIWPRHVGRLVRATVGRVIPPIADKLESLSSGIAEGLAALPSVGTFLLFIVWSVVYWAFNAGSMWLFAVWCGVDLGPMEIAAVMSVTAIVLLVPGGPAQVGNFQAGMALGFSLFLTEAAVAGRPSTFAFYLYLSQMGMGIVLGLGAQRALGLDWRRVFRPGQAIETPAEVMSTDASVNAETSEAEDA